MSKLLTIEGLGPQEYELLEAAGWNEPRSLAGANADKLVAELAKANSMLRILDAAPDRGTVVAWIRAAKDLAGGPKVAGPEKAAAKGTASAQPKTRKAGATESLPSRSGPKIMPPSPLDVLDDSEDPAVAAAEAAELAEREDEEALARVSGPVNYEADPQVMEMLAVAPVAVPIPAKTLAERGIRPSEIAVATLLNRALGDLEIRATTEVAPDSPKKADLPEGSKDARHRNPDAVTMSDPAFVSRRGIDVGKLRSVDELQSQPTVRSSSSSSRMEDDRVALIRATRAETNAGRRPSSRLYIRGVLHDRPFRVWFGGLFVLLLQLTLPLAILAAPLLILSNEMPLHFDWVPKWLIAFPIAVPILGVLYAIVSTGAKCRVCTQRLYVRKQCLKNRKAHHLPYFGYIGALALHVLVFRWFTCTFCGTAIRIKK